MSVGRGNLGSGGIWSECNQVYKTNDSIFGSAFMQEIVRHFPNFDTIERKSKLYEHLLTDKIVVISNQIPAISEAMCLNITQANPIGYLTI